MKTDHILFPVFLIVVGIVAVGGVDLFGAAILEGAAWKQNVILALLLIFGMIPQNIREMKATWMVAGYALAFFMFGGANIIGTVGIMLAFEKIFLAVLMLFMCYRLWQETWQKHKLYMAIPVSGLIFIAMLFPIQDQNVIGSGLDALMNWSASEFTSDSGFQILLGLAGICAGASEMLIRKKSEMADSLEVAPITE